MYFVTLKASDQKSKMVKKTKKTTIVALQGVQGRPGPEGKPGTKGEKVKFSCSNAIYCLFFKYIVKHCYDPLM